MLTNFNPELARQLFPLIFALLATVGFSTYVFLKAPASYKFKLLLIPIALLLAAYSYLFVGNLVGYSYPGKLPVKFVYVGHRVLVTDEGVKTGLEVWTQVGRDARLYRVPYNKQLDQNLERAAKAKGQGGVPVLDASKPPGDDTGRPGKRGGDDKDDYPHSLSLMFPTDVMPKNQPEEPVQR